MVIGWREVGSKAAAAALKPAIDALKPQIARRGAAAIAGQSLQLLSAHFDEALSLISENAGSLGQFLSDKLKRVLSDIPDVFDDSDVKLWLQQDAVRALVIEGARAALSGQPFDESRNSAAASFASFSSDGQWWGEFVFDTAVAFVALSIEAKLNFGDRAAIDNAAFLASQTHDRLDKIEELLRVGTYPPEDAVRALVEPEIEKADRLRALTDAERPNRLVQFAERVVKGDLHAADNNLRISLFLSTAAALARVKRTDEADRWVEEARNAGANDFAPDLARIALNRDQLAEVFTLLKSRTDCVSVMLVGEALTKRDGVSAGLGYVRSILTPGSMTGFAIATVADWLQKNDEWEEAEQILAAATERQKEENPTIPYSLMRLRIALMIPAANERTRMIGGDSYLPKPHDLRSDAEGLRLRMAALSALAEFRHRISDLEPRVTCWFDAQRLYLELLNTDENQFIAAVSELQTKCEEPDNSILFASIAVVFGLNFGIEIAQRELDRKELLNGLADHDLIGALPLIMRRPPTEIILFLDRYHDALLAAGAPLPFVVGLRIELLAKTGDTPHARSELKAWESRLGEEAVARLEAILVEVENGALPVAQWRKAFEISDTDGDLSNLVEAMIVANHPELGEFAIKHWQRRHRIEETIRAATALFNAQRDRELDLLLTEIGDAGEASDDILRHRAWAAFRAGQLDEARRRTTELRARLPHDQGLRQLEINVALESGRWGDLGKLANEDYERREHREALQLLQGAQFAQLINDPIAEQLARAAAHKNPDDPVILLSAFQLAVERGTDWGTEAGGWFRTAIALSDANGPVQQGELREVVEMIKDRQAQAIELDRMMLAGQVPFELAVRRLGVTVSELLLDRLSRNAEQRDARRRYCLPLIAGNRFAGDMSGFHAVAFDLASLLTLELLGLLDEALLAFRKVVIPAGTLPYLFDDYFRAHRGQRSRFQQADRLKALITANKINVIKLPDCDDGDRGELLFAAQTNSRYVHDFPIHEPGSFGERTMDLTEISAEIVSPAGVIDVLENGGELDTASANAARTMLGSSAMRWPSEMTVDFSRPILLNIVALNGLENARVLTTLIMAGAQLVVTDVTERAIDDEIREWQASRNTLEAIEGFREKLVAATAAGRITHGGFRRDGAEAELDGSLGPSPIIALLSDASKYDALVSAERMFTREAGITDRMGQSRPLFTILDVIDELARKELIEPSRRLAARTKLRACGVSFIPVDADEIVQAAAQGDWKNDPPRAIREIVNSIHLPLIRHAIDLPREMHWVSNALANMVVAIRRCWAELPDEIAEPAATWLLKALPDSHWVARQGATEELRQWAANTRVIIHTLLAQPVAIPEERLDQYDGWHESLVGPQLAGRDRDIKSIAFNNLAQAVSDVEPASFEGEVVVPKNQVCMWLLRHVPSAFRAMIIGDERIQTSLGFGKGILKILDHRVSFNNLREFLKTTINGGISHLEDVNGNIVAEAGEINEAGDAVAVFGQKRVAFDFSGLLHENLNERTLNLDRLFADGTLEPERISFWRSAVTDRALESDELHELVSEFSWTPEAWAEQTKAKQGKLAFSDLCAKDRRYFAALFPLDPQLSLADALTQAVGRRMHGPNIAASARALAPLTITSNFDIIALTSALGDAEIAQLSEQLLSDGDLFSILAAFQIASARSKSAPCVEAGTKALDAMLGDGGHLQSAANDFSAVAVAAIGCADALGVLADLPLSHRRCALLALSGHTIRGLGGIEYERPEFLDAVLQWLGPGNQLGGMVERQVGRWWVREWLHPAVVAAQFRARVIAIIRAVPDEFRPERWAFELKAHDDANPDILEQITGPLDEFSSSWKTLEFPTDIMEHVLDDDNIDQASNTLLNIIMAFELPDNPKIARDAVLSLLKRCSPDNFNMAVKLALLAAWRWADAELAIKAYQSGISVQTATNISIRTKGEWAVSAGACIADAAERARVLEQNFRQLINIPLTPAQAREMLGLIDKLQDFYARDDWISEIRSTLLLAA